MRGLLLSVAVALLCAAALGRAAASEVYSPGTVGLDISWPQCGSPLPGQAGAFTVIGVTGGRALTSNPCFAEQVTWARAKGSPISLYMNMKFPSGATVAEGMSGPAGNCRADDFVCQTTNYGYKTAQHAVALARGQGLDGAMWWLDVETTSTWSETTGLNVLVIRSAIDYLQSVGLGVGIYSSAYQWGIIAGDYAPGLPVWAGGSAGSPADPSRCRTGGFAGGRVVLIQYLAGGFDTNYVCRANDYVAPMPQPTSHPSVVPASLTVPAPTPTAPVGPPPGSISGQVPPRGYGLVVFNGGSAEQLVAAARCAADTAVFFFAFDGEFTAYVPAARVAAVNERFYGRFPGGAIPPATPLIGKCS